MAVSELVSALTQAAVAGFPVDPTAPDDRETIVDYTLVYTTEAERADEINLPEVYSVPVYGDVGPLAARIVARVLETLAEAAKQEIWFTCDDLRRLANETREEAGVDSE